MIILLLLSAYVQIELVWKFKTNEIAPQYVHTIYNFKEQNKIVFIHNCWLKCFLVYTCISKLFCYLKVEVLCIMYNII